MRRAFYFLKTGTLRYVVLFAVPFIIRIFTWLFGLAYTVGWGMYDTHVYLEASKSYADGLMQLDLSKFNVNIEHPPLAKLILGLGIALFPPILSDFEKALVVLCIVSSITGVLVYFVGETVGGRKVGTLAWLLYTLDPYSIHWTVAWLDSFVNLFILAAIFVLIRQSLDLRKRWILAGFFGALATLSKYIAAPYFFLVTIFFAPTLMSAALGLAACALFHAALNVHLWLPHVITSSVSMNVKMNVGVPAMIYGPIKIGYPAAYPWYLLTYLGVGYTSPRAAPYIIPFIALSAIFYRVMAKRRFSENMLPHLFMWAAASIIPLAFLPRHYWMPLSEFPGIEVKEGAALVKTFYPYYHVITAPSLSILTAALILDKGSWSSPKKFSKKLLRMSIFFVLMFAALSPLALTANMIHPYWDFLFTLIININNPELSSLAISSFTLTLVLVLIEFTLVFYLLTKIERLGVYEADSCYGTKTATG